MTSIRNFAYAALLAFTSLNLAATLASAQDAAHGKFTLTHEVHWGNAKLSAGDYEFSLNPDAGLRMLSLSRLSGTRAGYMMLVSDTDDARPSDLSRLVIESTPAGSYVSAMHLPEFGITLHFRVPSHAQERPIAKAATTAAASGQ
jgi:hypothetical protein